MVPKVFRAISFVLILIKNFGYAADLINEPLLNYYIDENRNSENEDLFNNDVSVILENRSTESSFCDYQSSYHNYSFFMDYNPIISIFDEVDEVDEKNEIFVEQSTNSIFYRYSFIYNPQNNSFIEVFYECPFFIKKTGTKGIYQETCSEKIIPLLMTKDVKNEKMNDSVVITDNNVAGLLELNQNTEKEHEEGQYEESNVHEEDLAEKEPEPENDKVEISVVIAEESGFQNLIDQITPVSASINVDKKIDSCVTEILDLVNVDIDPAVGYEIANTLDSKKTTQEATSDLDESGIFDLIESDDGINDTSTVSENLKDESKKIKIDSKDPMKDIKKIVKEPEIETKQPNSGKIISNTTSETPSIPETNLIQAKTTEIVPETTEIVGPIIVPVITTETKAATSQKDKKHSKSKSSAESTSLFMIFILFGVFGLIVFVSALGVWQYRKAQVQL